MNLINILLVEDDELDVIDIQRNLGKMGILYSLQVARNGEEAIEMLKEAGNNLPDFVLVDINMPKMNGLEFLTHIRESEKWKNLKCFVITTSEEHSEKEKTKKLGVLGYIVKPFKVNNPSSIDSFNLMVDLINFKKVS